jgi:hypothetical protein
LEINNFCFFVLFKFPVFILFFNFKNQKDIAWDIDFSQKNNKYDIRIKLKSKKFMNIERWYRLEYSNLLGLIFIKLQIGIVFQDPNINIVAVFHHLSHVGIIYFLD